MNENRIKRFLLITVSNWSVSQLGDWLREQGVAGDVITAFARGKITGFMLTAGDVSEDYLGQIGSFLIIIIVIIIMI